MNVRDFHKPGRSLAYGEKGMAATSHPKATLAALDVLRAGGNAVDAAIAAGAVQAVVDPAMTSIAGDAFIMLAPAGGGLIVVNGSGKAPAAADAGALRAQGLSEIAQQHPAAVTVPCGVSAWCDLHGSHGKLDLEAVLAPAIACAEDGFLVTPRVARDFVNSDDILNANAVARSRYMPNGRPMAGDKLTLPELGSTLRAIAKGGADAFYRGALAEAMVESLQTAGAVHTLDDFAAGAAWRSDPISTVYRDLEIFECPPSGQGIIALLMLNILEGYDLASLDPHGSQRFHLEAEATKLAFAERQAHLADPEMAPVPTETLLSKDFAASLRDRIDPARARPMGGSAIPAKGHTVYLSVVDKDLNAVSFIQSLYSDFGTGICCPKTGVLFHCRGRGFSLEAGHPNEFMPGKRPMHTIIPGMAFKNGEAVMSFGVMGADYQPVGQAHVVTNIVDYGMDVQSALDSPRAMAFPHDLEIETTLDGDVQGELAAMGHDVVERAMPHGCGQAIMIDRERGVLMGGADHRKDGVALGL